MKNWLRKIIFCNLILAAVAAGHAGTARVAAAPEPKHIERIVSNSAASPNRFEILMDFEGFGNGEKWTLNADGAGHSFGPFQFYTGPSGQFGYFMKWLQTRDTDLFERLAAARLKGTGKFKTESELIFETEPHLFDLMKEFVAIGFDDKLERAGKLFNIDFSNRDEIIMGYLLCVQNNRNNDIFKVLSRMAETSGGADALNAMGD
ncbi:MAG: hypothetical protein LBD94_01550, partial [Rickettsiales bacterium]|nr:hypothetical protein [Rickettsiales bacterium]